MDNVTVSMQEGTHWQFFKQQEEELVEEYKRPKQKKSTIGPSIIL